MASLQSVRAQQIAEEAAAHFSEPGVTKLFMPSSLGQGMTPNNNIGFEYDSIEEAFPSIDPRITPVGNMVLIQIRQPKLRASSATIITVGDRKTEHDNTQVGKVIAVGALAFHNRQTFEIWPEGAWCKVGDFVRIPKYQGDFLFRTYKRPDYDIDDRGRRTEFMVDDVCHFVQFKDIAILGVYPDADAALAERAFL